MAAPIRKIPTRSFFPTGNTVALTVGTTSSNVNVVTTSTQCVVTNIGTNVVYVAFGTDDTITAAIPAAGTPANGMPILPNAKMELQLGNASYVAAIATATGNTLMITPGTAT
jgi:hypothetical protein